MTRRETLLQRQEARRKEAITLLNDGFSRQEVADKLDVDPSSVSRWKKTYEEEGMMGLDASSPPKREPVLDDDQLLELAAYLRDGPRQHGFENDFWTHKQVMALIEEKFDTSIALSTLYSYMKRMEWEYRKAKNPPGERDLDAIERDRQKKFERVQQMASSDKSILER
ncbi:helix-turn-helix domain-containing protein [Natronomonas sp. CBA1123]|jgi:transposase|uniref:helix-turn-helix domain-containing protein n=1 Tax=Natronomonas sp. CBA1123 TaxID=2668070 RepID=UPI0012EA98F5|nr:winged helix-turn-helix domain-containing protein [Natronomonas sp. CBA1123]MUV85523.1 helix-turn-helix domain-containing protein [Natronomonas sp. CBA1123]